MLWPCWRRCCMWICVRHQWKHSGDKGSLHFPHNISYTFSHVFFFFSTFVCLWSAKGMFEHVCALVQLKCLQILYCVNVHGSVCVLEWKINTMDGDLSNMSRFFCLFYASKYLKIWVHLICVFVIRWEISKYHAFNSIVFAEEWGEKFLNACFVLFKYIGRVHRVGT